SRILKNSLNSMNTEFDKDQQILKERQGIVLGVILALFTGVIVSIIGNIIYDVWFMQEKSFSDIDIRMISLLMFFIILIESFLEFLLIERKNTPFDREFWKGYSRFSLQDHWAAVLSHKATSIFTWFISWSFWALFIISSIS